LARKSDSSQTTHLELTLDTNDRSAELERLLGCARHTSIFLNAEGVPFALIPGEMSNQADVAFLRSGDFAAFLRQDYHARYRHYPKEAHLRVVRDLLDRDVSRRAQTSPPVAVRVARGKAECARGAGQPQAFRQILALDLGLRSSAAAYLVLEVDADGWSVNDRSGFAFVRARGHRPLPLPELACPEALTEFKHLLRVDDDDWLRIVDWLINAMRPTGRYPILVLQGNSGSGKSLAARMLKSLLDPAAVPFQQLPTNPNTVLRQATQTWIQAFDHVTGVSRQISAALCRLSTSAAFSLAADPSRPPITINLARPILMTIPPALPGSRAATCWNACSP
jgi:hypothetical protein